MTLLATLNISCIAFMMLLLYIMCCILQILAIFFFTVLILNVLHSNLFYHPTCVAQQNDVLLAKAVFLFGLGVFVANALCIREMI